jgi:hypothetical protein
MRRSHMRRPRSIEDGIMLIVAFPVALTMMIGYAVRTWWQDLKDDIRDGDYY